MGACATALAHGRPAGERRRAVFGERCPFRRLCIGRGAAADGCPAETHDVPDDHGSDATTMATGPNHREAVITAPADAHRVIDRPVQPSEGPAAGQLGTSRSTGSSSRSLHSSTKMIAAAATALAIDVIRNGMPCRADR
jgi:hypothetical protein